MKSKAPFKRLSFNKTTIADLRPQEQLAVKAGNVVMVVVEPISDSGSCVRTGELGCPAPAQFCIFDSLQC
jgi:hypothetical protein